MKHFARGALTLAFWVAVWTALALIGELVEAGCLVNLTGRRTARFWALPSFCSSAVDSAAASA